MREDYEQFRRAQPLQLTDEQRDLVRELAEDIPALWNSPTTTPQDRQQIVRMLIERIELNIEGQSEQTDVMITWAGGFTSQHRLRRIVCNYAQRSDLDQLLARVLALKQTCQNLDQVAEQINREGFFSLRSAPFNGAMLSRLLLKRGIHRRRSESAPDSPHLRPDEWWLKDLARHLAMSDRTLTYWRKSGWLQARYAEIAGGRWIVWADPSEIDRLLRLKDQPQSCSKHHPTYPVELTTPKPRPILEPE